MAKPTNNQGPKASAKLDLSPVQKNSAGANFVKAIFFAGTDGTAMFSVDGVVVQNGLPIDAATKTVSADILFPPNVTWMLIRASVNEKPDVMVQQSVSVTPKQEPAKVGIVVKTNRTSPGLYELTIRTGKKDEEVFISTSPTVALTGVVDGVLKVTDGVVVIRNVNVSGASADKVFVKLQAKSSGESTYCNLYKN